VTPADLLKTKIFAPRLTARLVERPRLLRTLDAGLQAGVRLILVSAPAGFGKSTLVSEWLAAAGPSSLHVAWVSLDEEDNDPARFLAYLLLAIENAHTGLPTAALDELQSTQISSPRAVFAGLINATTALPAPLVLVLDDYHLISNAAIHEGLNYLLDHMPANLHLLITTRSDPPFALARLRARQQMVEVRTADLRFNLDEAAHFLNQSMHLELSSGDTQTLEQHTEGWITGLQLAALSMQAAPDRAGFIASFTGSHRFILDYLVEEVLRTQPAQVQTFLLDTAILERMNGALCAAVLGTDFENGAAPCQEMLERLEQSNLFIIPLDNQRQWYRYHHLFADFLRNRLQNAAPERSGELHRRAMHWFEQNGMPDDAIHHALQAARSGQVDFSTVASLIEQTAPLALQRSEIGLLSAWIGALPTTLVETRPRLYVYYTWALIFSGTTSVSTSHLDTLEQLVHNITDPNEAEELAHHHRVLQLFQDFNRGNPNRTAELANQALDRIPADEIFLRGMAAQIRDMLSYIIGEPGLPAPGDSYDAVIQASGHKLLTQLAALTQAMRFKMQGRLRQAETALQASLAMIESSPASQNTMLAHMVYEFTGDLLRERNELQAAEQCLRKAQAIGFGGEPGNLAIEGYLNLAHLRLAQGNKDAAQQVLNEARHTVSGALRPSMAPLPGKLPNTLNIFEARAALLLKDLPAIEQLLAGVPDPTGDERPRTRQEIMIFFVIASSRARLYLMKEQYSKAEELARCIVPLAPIADEPGKHIEACILLALALAGQKRPAEALEALAQALSLAEPEGYVRIFLDEGPAMLDLLHIASMALKDPGPKAYARRLLEAAGDTRQPAQPTVVLTQAGLLEPLSEREIEILRLIAAGLSNKTIAERLFLAESTIKSHINHIYTKLDISSRTQAIVRAREMGLLDD